MKRLVICAAAVPLVFAALLVSPADAAQGRPDGRIKVQSGGFVGNNVFTPPDPLAEQARDTIDTATFVAKVKNRGTKRDTITVSRHR
jgi:hypothetical protein